MIELSIQFKIIIFSFIFGFLFSIIMDYFNLFILKYRTKIKLLYTLLLIIFTSILYFVGINKIGNSPFHIYSIFCIVIGFYSYNIFVNLIAKTAKK